MVEMHKDKEKLNHAETAEEKETAEKEFRGRKELKNEVVKLKSEVEHWKNEYYRAYADTRNLRATLEKEQSRALKYRAEGFIEALLPILDSFYLALKQEPTDPALKNYLTGFQYIYRNLVSVLESEGVKEITPQVGDKFDPLKMNAMDVVETDGEANLVANVYGKGYQLHDMIVRHAMVSVTGKPKAKENKPEQNPEAQKPEDAPKHEDQCKCDA
jgi:molecular chaperone GrpE